jgi:hypothetical protein
MRGSISSTTGFIACKPQESRLNHSGAPRGYNRLVAIQRKSARSHRVKPQSVRQSVTIPGDLAVQVRGIAKEWHLTVSRALIALAERGIRAELEAKRELRKAYRRFMGESEPAQKNAAGKDLISAIFGKDALAEDTLL